MKKKNEKSVRKRKKEKKRNEMCNINLFHSYNNISRTFMCFF